jgi:hypothetical protein
MAPTHPSSYIACRICNILLLEHRDSAYRLADALAKEIKMTVDTAAGTPDGAVVITGTTPRDGRYEGGNDELFMVLRIDCGGAAVISGDVYRVHATGRDYVASVRTAPGLRVALGAPEAGTIGAGGTGTGGACADGNGQPPRGWVAAWQDSLGATTTGRLDLTPVAERDDAVAVSLRLDQRLNGLPPRTDLTVEVAHVSAELRPLGLEVDTEEQVRLPGPVLFEGADAGFRECLRKAGFAVHDAGQPTTIPRQAAGWNGSVIFTVLNDLMAASSQADLTAPGWQLNLLMLSRTTRAGLLGIMFDSSDALPRQGAAVFVDEIRERIPDDVEDRKIVQTTVHELGHALNLAHRFERGVGRADSTSFMNYDWRYRGGQRAEEFWQRFAFTFDADELEFLNHAPHSVLVPGGAPFHSVNYWADGTGGYSPYVPEISAPGFELTLAPPAAGPVFAFGQPVFLEVTLRNLGDAPVQLPPEVLDPKTGALELLIRRFTGASGGGLADATPFVPIMQRCFDADATAADTVPPGGTLRNNVNLTFGSGGFAFAEPGTYDVTPLLGFATNGPDGNQAELVIRGPALRIRVAYPHDLAEEHDALTLMRPDVGAWFALGGSDCLSSARESLNELHERRRATRGTADPVVASIVRTAGIDAGRPGVRFAGGRFTSQEGDPQRAAELLTSLDTPALRTFDPHTAEHTAALADRYRAQS